MDELKSDAATAAEKKTLLELIEAFMAETPTFDGRVGELLRKHPDLIGPDAFDPLQKRYRTNFKLGKLVAIFTLNFLCRAYGLPDRGYIPGTEPPTKN